MLAEGEKFTCGGRCEKVEWLVYGKLIVCKDESVGGCKYGWVSVREEESMGELIVEW